MNSHRRLYQAALQQDADAIEDAPESIQLVMKKSLARTWKKLADERLEDQNPTIPWGTKFWSLSKSERSPSAKGARPRLLRARRIPYRKKGLIVGDRRLRPTSSLDQRRNR